MTRNIACLAFILATCGPCFADDPPDSEVNPQTGLIETVSTVSTASTRGVRLTIDRGAIPPISNEIAQGATDYLGPRIAIASTGKVSVVWTEEASISRIRVRTRTSSGWGVTRLVSDATENSRNPEITQDGSSTWVVYQVDGTSAKSVAVSIIGDEPDPIGARIIVTTVSSAGDTDARIQAEAGHLWVTWVDDNSRVGWSESDGSGGWTDAAYQSYSAADTDSARSLIRQELLGL